MKSKHRPLIVEGPHARSFRLVRHNHHGCGSGLDIWNHTGARWPSNPRICSGRCCFPARQSEAKRCKRTGERVRKSVKILVIVALRRFGDDFSVQGGARSCVLAGHGWHKYQVFVPIAGAALTICSSVWPSSWGDRRKRRQFRRGFHHPEALQLVRSGPCIPGTVPPSSPCHPHLNSIL